MVNQSLKLSGVYSEEGRLQSLCSKEKFAELQQHNLIHMFKNLSCRSHCNYKETDHKLCEQVVVEIHLFRLGGGGKSSKHEGKPLCCEEKFSRASNIGGALCQVLKGNKNLWERGINFSKDGSSMIWLGGGGGLCQLWCQVVSVMCAARLPINILYLNCNCCSQFTYHHVIPQINVSHFVSIIFLRYHEKGLGYIHP